MVLLVTSLNSNFHACCNVIALIMCHTLIRVYKQCGHTFSSTVVYTTAVQPTPPDSKLLAWLRSLDVDQGTVEKVMQFV